MKSFLLFCAVAGAGAVSDASKCQADENTLLQGLSTMRKVKKTAAKSKDAKALLQEMREIADSLGSDSTMSEGILGDLLDNLHAEFLEVREATLQQLANEQQQIIDATGAFQACTTKELISLRQSVGQHAAAVESCQSALAQLQAAERQQCAKAEDCLCDEARVRTTDKEALCSSKTDTYEAVFCEQHGRCTTAQQCHSSLAEVYQRVTADVQAEFGFIVESYKAIEQGICLNRLSFEHQKGRRLSPIPKAARDACDDVDVSGLNINYPAAPAPPTCPAHTHGDPECAASELDLLQENAAKSKDAKALLQEMREIANSLVEGSDSTMSEGILGDLLDNIHAEFLEIREATLQEVATAQQEIIDALGGFRACTTKELISLRQSVGQRAAAVESCQSTLAQLQAAERQQCAKAEDCLCDEARVRTTDQEALCSSITETYEAVFCEQDDKCTTAQQCHSSLAEVYQRLTTDVQAEFGFIVESYIATEQGICLNRLSFEHQKGRRLSPIPKAARDACDDVDVSGLNINYPAAPAPPTCPAHTHGDPECA